MRCSARGPRRIPKTEDMKIVRRTKSCMRHPHIVSFPGRSELNDESRRNRLGDSFGRSRLERRLRFLSDVKVAENSV